MKLNFDKLDKLSQSPYIIIRFADETVPPQNIPKDNIVICDKNLYATMFVCMHAHIIGIIGTMHQWGKPIRIIFLNETVFEYQLPEEKNDNQST